MLKDILVQNLHVVFVGTATTEIADDLGFYYLAPKNRFWEMLEYANLTSPIVISQSDRSALENAKQSGVLNDVYKQFFFEKKESIVLKHHIGLTDLNRRFVVSKEDDPSAEPTPDDIQKFIKKIEKFKPTIVAFVTGVDVFEKCFKRFYPAASRQRGRQAFLIGNSEVWLLGSTGGRVKDVETLEQVFGDLADRLKEMKK